MSARDGTADLGPEGGRDLSRRGFLKGMSVGALAAGALAPTATALLPRQQEAKGPKLFGPAPVDVTLRNSSRAERAAIV